MARGFDSVPDRGGRDNLRETDIFDILPLSQKAKNNWISLRFIPGDLLPIKKHWIKILGGKDKDKEVTIPRICVSFDPDNESTPLADRSCPYCKLPHGGDDTGAPARVDIKYLAQAIVRDLQKTAPRKLPKHTSNEKKSGYKDKDSDSWTPVRVVPLTPGVARRIRELGDRNFIDKQKKETRPVSDAKYGLDIDIQYNPKAAGAEKYSIDKGERTPLDSEEKAYLTWNVDDWAEIYDLLGRLDSKDALKDFKGLDVVGSENVDDEEEDEDEDEDNMRLGRKSKKGKKSKLGSKKSKYDDDEEDEDDEDEDDLPRRRSPLSKKGKKAKPSSKKPKSKYDDDEDDEDDEDELPVRKKSKKPLKSDKKVTKKPLKSDKKVAKKPLKSDKKVTKKPLKSGKTIVKKKLKK